MNYIKRQWKAYPVASGNWTIEIDEKPNRIKSLALLRGNEQESNAHLISAAPEMYEALLEAMNYILCNIPDSDNRKQHIEFYTKALAKASGDS